MVDAVPLVESPCSWPIQPCKDAESIVPDPVEREVYEVMAVDYLRAWTGGVFGLCPTTVRPCRDDCSGRPPTHAGRGPYPRGHSADLSGQRSGAWLPVLIGGEWHNVSCFRCGSSTCSCESVSAVALPGPIHSVEQVRLDGAVMDPANYRVDNRRFLVRLDGGDWPVCQDIAADPATDPDTWDVTYTRGLPVPVGGQVAAGLLACELAKAALGDPSCALPRRVQTITRQGVTVAMLDSFDDVEKGHTGIWGIDSWLASVTRAPRRSTVRSPDYTP